MDGSDVKRAPASPSTTCSSLSDDGDQEQQVRDGRDAGLQSGFTLGEDNEAFVAEQFQKYLVNTE